MSNPHNDDEDVAYFAAIEVERERERLEGKGAAMSNPRTDKVDGLIEGYHQLQKMQADAMSTDHPAPGGPKISEGSKAAKTLADTLKESVVEAIAKKIVEAAKKSAGSEKFSCVLDTRKDLGLDRIDVPPSIFNARLAAVAERIQRDGFRMESLRDDGDVYPAHIRILWG